MVRLSLLRLVSAQDMRNALFPLALNFPEFTFDVAPRRGPGDIGAQKSRKGDDLLVGQSTREARHPRTDFTLRRRDAVEHDTDKVCWRRKHEARSEGEIERASRRRSLLAALVTSSACAGVDRTPHPQCRIATIGSRTRCGGFLRCRVVLRARYAVFGTLLTLGAYRSGVRGYVSGYGLDFLRRH